MDLVEVLLWVQAALFVGLAAAALGTALQQRTAPTRYAAAAFVGLALAAGIGRAATFRGTSSPAVLDDLTLVVLVAFPWFLTAFAWSFTGRLPAWLRTAGVMTVALAILAVPLPPLGDVTDRSWIVHGYVAAALVLWVALSGAAAARLWLAGAGQRVVRARTRLLATASVVLAGALMVAGVTPPNAPLSVGVTTATLAAALLFVVGFAPPAVLRLYWHHLPNRRWEAMQSELIAASTPEQAAEAVVPVVAEAFGGGTLCTDAGGRLISMARLTDDEAAALARRLAAGDQDSSGLQVAEADGWHLAVKTSPFAPVFGDDERGLLARFANQLRLAVQRADLFAAHQDARSQIEASSRDLQAMLVGLAHDLRSPAVTISTYAALLPDARDEDELEQMLAGVRDASGYLDRLVEGLLELSRIGRNDGEPEPVDLAEVSRGVARRLAAAHPSLTVGVADDLPVVVVDRLRIEQVVDNLLGNAAKHGGRDDLTVTVTWQATTVGGVLRVADDGDGIAEDEREAVFSLFRRGATSAAGSGVGLGLVRRIVEHLGGSVRFADRDDGAAGAVVELRLPTEALAAPSSTVTRRPPLPTARIDDGQVRTRTS